MGPAIAVKKRKLKHDTGGASSEVVKQPSAALSPSIKVQGNGNGNEAGVGKIVGKPLAFLNDSRDLMKIPFYCMKCKADLGIAANIWSKTSKNHFTPTKYESQDLNGLTASGRTSKSPEGGDLGGWYNTL
ncbi:MAG: hypothetical protein M1830_008128 [Pleopsidium flavum]|nr:MAG: hypothetical protein M1830_008132 [Pleopsidium flavum]KAI9875670.1 MAG: hypothetical protein M1830_008128 [Pleopsidium flavum]